MHIGRSCCWLLSGTPLRNEMGASDADKLAAATNYAASKIGGQTRQRRGCCKNSGTRRRGRGLVLDERLLVGSKRGHWEF